jgi:predicted amidohydrolase
MFRDLPGAHPPRIHRDDLVIEPRKPALVFGNQLRINKPDNYESRITPVSQATSIQVSPKMLSHIEEPPLPSGYRPRRAANPA